MMEVRTYREGDERNMEFRPADDWGISREHLMFMAVQCPSWVVYINNKPVMVFGAWFLWKGAWEAWAMPTEQARGHAVTIVRTIRDALRLFNERDDVSRLTCMVREFDTEYQKFMHLVGFRVEYMLEKAYDGKYDIYGYRYGFKQI